MFSKLLNLESERKNTIINAALREFARKGYDDASTNVIAKEASISKPLMFHYVNNKKDFFLFLFDYCVEILQGEYFDKVDLSERDLLERLRKTSILKIEVIKKYPWIFDFIKMTVLMESEEIDGELKQRKKRIEQKSLTKYYGDIDLSKFRDNLDIEMTKQLIFWAVGGYAEGIVERLRNSSMESIDLDDIHREFDKYLNELRKAYYKEQEGDQ